MSIITSIQKRTGLLLIVILGALAAFVLGDLLMGANRISGGGDKIGEINGVDIKIKEFNERVQEVRARMEASGQPVSESLMPSIRSQAWNDLVVEYALKPEWEKLGITVTEQEIVDMVQGNFIHPQIRQSFTNPETGEFDKDKVAAFLRNLSSQPPQVQAQWNAFETQLPQMRKSEKYENLIRNTIYITSQEAKRRYEEENTKLDLKYAFIPYTNIPDSAITLSTEEIAKRVDAYYAAHKEEYDDLASVAIEYVELPIQPSETDSAEAKRYLMDIKDKFAQAENDTNFVAIHSQAKVNFADFLMANLPSTLKDENVSVGAVIGPKVVKDAYVLYKVIQELEDTAYTAKASHILIRTQGKSDKEKVELKKKAEEVLAKARSGEDFTALARQYSDDTANKDNGGDLGWFEEGRMVEPFENAVFGASSTGVVPRIVETDFGYHIINVTGTKTNKKYRIATISRLLEPSAATREALYRKAGDIASSTSVEQYNERVKEYNLLSLQANNVKQNARSINNLYEDGVRSAILWAFNEETKVGSISKEVFEIDNRYIIIYLKDRTEKGIQPLSKVYEQVRRKVMDEAKAEYILAKLEGKAGSVEAVQEAMGSANVRVLEQNNFTYTTQALNAVGIVQKALGTAFAVKEGAITKPIADDTGVIVIHVKKRTEAAEIADHAQYKKPLEQDRQAKHTSSNIFKAIKEITDTEDNIDKFY